MRRYDDRHLTRSSGRVGVLFAACLLLTGCVSETVRSVDVSPPQQATDAVPEALLLDVGVAVFNANIPDDYDEQIKEHIAPDVRRAEGNFIAYTLKTMLQSTGNWGAVRVVPRATNAVDVMVGGTILNSDGAQLQLEVTVIDASGKQWFTRSYESLSSKYAYDPNVPAGIDPFQSIYKQIADDMQAFRLTLTEADVTRIHTVAEMVFARDFAPGCVLELCRTRTRTARSRSSACRPLTTRCWGASVRCASASTFSSIHSTSTSPNTTARCTRRTRRGGRPPTRRRFRYRQLEAQSRAQDDCRNRRGRCRNRRRIQRQFHRADRGPARRRRPAR